MSGNQKKRSEPGKSAKTKLDSTSGKRRQGEENEQDAPGYSHYGSAGLSNRGYMPEISRASTVEPREFSPGEV